MSEESEEENLGGRPPKFETPEELQAMRDQAAAEKKNLMYRRPKDFPDAKDAEKQGIIKWFV